MCLRAGVSHITFFVLVAISCIMFVRALQGRVGVVSYSYTLLIYVILKNASVSAATQLYGFEILNIIKMRFFLSRSQKKSSVATRASKESSWL